MVFFFNDILFKSHNLSNGLLTTLACIHTLGNSQHLLPYHLALLKKQNKKNYKTEAKIQTFFSNHVKCFQTYQVPN